MPNEPTKEHRTGLATDASGGPVIDPTANVLALVEAATTRADDLRELTIKYLDSRMNYIERIGELRAAHAKEISELESSRLNAIRQVDVLAVSTASDRASAQALVLANQVATSAETLRSLVASTAQSVAASQAQLAAGLTERISLIEKAQYESKGKSLMVDPQMQDLLAEMKSLRESRDIHSGKTAGIGVSWGVIVGAIGIIVSLLAIFTFFNSRQPIQIPVVTVPK